MNERVNIVIPVFNGESSIVHAVNSALSQVDCTFDITVVNDGSTDGTNELLDTFGDKVNIINQSNLGIAGLGITRNKGANASDSHWIAFLDHDDEWKPSKLSSQLAAAKATGADLIYTGVENIDETGRVADEKYVSDGAVEGNVFNKLIYNNFIATSSVLIRRSCFDAVGGFSTDPEVLQDWDLWLRVADRGFRFAFVKERLVKYTWRKNSVSKNFDRSRKRMLTCFKSACELQSGKRLSFLYRMRIVANIEYTNGWFRSDVDPYGALACFTRSLFHYPFSLKVLKSIIKILIGRTL
jgi:glycosyltransferase involved in cell wall biosynthesis